MKNIIKSIFVGILLLSMEAFAHSFDSEPFKLQGGVIKPGDIFAISFSPTLPQKGYFDLTCDVINPNYSKQYPIVLKIYMGYGNSGRITLNDKLLSAGEQGTLTKNSNHLEIQKVTLHNWYICLQNYDSSDIATVQDCIATYS